MSDVDAGAFPELAERRATVARRLNTIGRLPDGDISQSAERVCVVSEFVLGVLEKQQDRLLDRLASPESVAPAPEVLDCTEAEAMQRLRRHRQVEMARIAWRDIAGWADLDESLADLSALADAAVRLAVERAMRDLEPRFGRPATASGDPAPLLVLGMGKLGGRELNFSSDIDLVFVYPDDVALGKSDDAAEEYYRRVAQRLIRLLNEKTADGIVFRVDARLRPFGASGPLAVSLSAFESYLVQHGRDWERYAYVKARLITGERYADEVFAGILTPFVYRRYLDFGVFDALRQMKLLIERQVASKEMQANIKLGAGGIREIEFIAQIFQIIRGGQDSRLRERRLLHVLPTLADLEVLEPDESQRLIDAYRFLRVVENRLQALDDQQTHDLPASPEPRARLALALGMPEWPLLADAIDRHRQEVAGCFADVAWLAAPREAEPATSPALDAWEVGDLESFLNTTSLERNDELAGVFSRLRNGSLYRRMDEPSRRRLAGVMSRVLPLLEGREDPVAAIGRTVPVFEAICRRSAYLALLIENPTALSRLVDIAGSSPLLAQQMAEHPALLDELIDPRLFDSPPSREELQRTLAQGLAGTDDDSEAYIQAIRQFQRAAVFRIALADRLGGLPLMKVSDRLTDVAELVLDSALQVASDELTSTYGQPMHGSDETLDESGFAIVAYGKLGGLELGYGSDLDLVFLHSSEGSVQETAGPKVVDNQRFFARLAQRLIHFLSIQTTSGRLYEIDTRLRPSGASGAMVASLASFRKYQREQAWTWEHQALLRSRAVAGDRPLCEAFENERRDVLMHHVGREDLGGEISRMRARMRTELSVSATGEFDIKQDAGGLADIEFLIDFLVLRDAAEHPALIEYPDNVRQLEALAAAELLPAADCDAIRSIYLAYRSRIHELALAGDGKVTPDSSFKAERAAILGYWEAALGPAEAL